MNRFPRVLGVHPGYDPDEVDALIKRIEATLGKGVLESEPVTADEIRAARFRVRLGGYNEMAVDYALEAFIIAVENKDVPPRRAGEPGASAPGGPAAAEGTPASPPEPGAPEQHPPEPAAGAAPPADSSITPDAAARAVSGADREQGGTVPAAAGGGDGDRPTPPWPIPPDTAATPPGAYRAAESPWAAPLPPWPTRPDAAAGPAENADTGAGDAGAHRAETPHGPGRAGAEETEEWFEEQARRVERVSFRTGRLGMGYSEEEVDAFLDRVVATLRGTADAPLTAADVREARFSTVLFRAGYAIGEVDEFLADIAEVIARRG